MNDLQVYCRPALDRLTGVATGTKYGLTSPDSRASMRVRPRRPLIRRSLIPVRHIRIRGGRGGAAAGLVDVATLLLFEAAQRTAFIGLLVLDDAVDFASLVPFRQVLGNRKTFRIAEE